MGSRDDDDSDDEDEELPLLSEDELPSLSVLKLDFA
jgi:hypothetical protein